MRLSDFDEIFFIYLAKIQFKTTFIQEVLAQIKELLSNNAINTIAIEGFIV